MQTTSKRCTAHVTLKRGRVKEYSGRSVYLKNDQEFEIELYNPHQKAVLAKIYLNGVAISDGGLVLRPAERVYLERYLDDNKKFKFGTYEIENTKSNREAIEKNGDLRVEFFYELEPVASNWNLNGHITINQPWVYGPSTPCYPSWEVTNTGGYGTVNIGNASSSSLLVGGSTTAHLFTSNSGNSSYSTGMEVCCDSGIVNCSNTLETGRVEKGNVSAQALVTVNQSFNSWYSETEAINILPASQKPREVSEIRNYCSGCSARIKKSSWKFCPYCQTPLND